jgi:hypothetical protein
MTLTQSEIESQLSDLQSRVTELESAEKSRAEQPVQTTTNDTPEGVENVVNPGEDLGRTPTSPELDPHQPGVEPGNAEPVSSPNAPASTDPEGDTAKQNAPDAPAPEPDGQNVATNPGTSSSSDAQTETPVPGGSGTVGELGVYADDVVTATGTEGQATS